MIRKVVALALILPVLGCSPIESAVLGGASGLWQKHEMMNLEKRVAHLEKILKERNCQMNWLVSYNNPVLLELASCGQELE